MPVSLSNLPTTPPSPADQMIAEAAKKAKGLPNAVGSGPGGESVSILASPPVPDLGGNSIIWGLLHGNYKAVLPNLRVCARKPLGAAWNR